MKRKGPFWNTARRRVMFSSACTGRVNPDVNNLSQRGYDSQIGSSTLIKYKNVKSENSKSVVIWVISYWFPSFSDAGASMPPGATPPTTPKRTKLKKKNLTEKKNCLLTLLTNPVLFCLLEVG